MSSRANAKSSPKSEPEEWIFVNIEPELQEGITVLDRELSVNVSVEGVREAKWKTSDGGKGSFVVKEENTIPLTLTYGARTLEVTATRGEQSHSDTFEIVRNHRTLFSDIPRAYTSSKPKDDLENNEDPVLSTGKSTTYFEVKVSEDTMFLPSTIDLVATRADGKEKVIATLVSDGKPSYGGSDSDEASGIVYHAKVETQFTKEEDIVIRAIVRLPTGERDMSVGHTFQVVKLWSDKELQAFMNFEKQAGVVFNENYRQSKSYSKALSALVIWLKKQPQVESVALSDRNLAVVSLKGGFSFMVGQPPSRPSSHKEGKFKLRSRSRAKKRF